MSESIVDLAQKIHKYLSTISHSELESLIPAIMVGHGIPSKAKGLGIMVSDIKYFMAHGDINPYEIDRRYR